MNFSPSSWFISTVFWVLESILKLWKNEYFSSQKLTALWWFIGSSFEFTHKIFSLSPVQHSGVASTNIKAANNKDIQCLHFCIFVLNSLFIDLSLVDMVQSVLTQTILFISPIPPHSYLPGILFNIIPFF